jgi:hypothetical protein
MSKKIITGGTGITAGGDVTIGDVSGQVAIGENIPQTQTLSSSDKKDLLNSLIEFRKEIARLDISDDEKSTINGDINAAIREAEKEKPDPSKIKSRFEGALDTVNEVGDTIEKVSGWEWTKKVISTLGKLGLSILI